MHVRVAISQKFSEEELEFPIRNISKMIQKSATIVAGLVDFVVETKPHTHRLCGFERQKKSIKLPKLS